MKRMTTAPAVAASSPHHGRGRRGSSLVEFTLVFGLLLLVAFGAIEYSYAFYVKNTLQAAARETARAGIVPDATKATAEDAGKKVLTAAFGAGKVSQFEFAWKNNKHPGNTNSGDYIEVTVRAPNWNSIGLRPLGSIPLFAAAAPSPTKRFEAVATMRRE